MKYLNILQDLDMSQLPPEIYMELVSRMDGCSSEEDATIVAADFLEEVSLRGSFELLKSLEQKTVEADVAYEEKLTKLNGWLKEKLDSLGSSDYVTKAKLYSEYYSYRMSLADSVTNIYDQYSDTVDTLSVALDSPPLEG